MDLFRRYRLWNIDFLIVVYTCVGSKPETMNSCSLPGHKRPVTFDLKWKVTGSKWHVTSCRSLIVIISILFHQKPGTFIPRNFVSAVSRIDEVWGSGQRNCTAPPVQWVALRRRRRSWKPKMHKDAIKWPTNTRRFLPGNLGGNTSGFFEVPNKAQSSSNDPL